MRKLFLLYLAVIAAVGSIACVAVAGPKEDVADATANWGRVFAENNPDTILALYAKDAVLWGTLSPTVRSDPGTIKAYFAGAFNSLPNITVKFGEQLIRVYGNMAINTGYYTFSYPKDGEAKTIAARYSLVFANDGGKWLIVDHHSSGMPPAPAPTPPR